MCQEVFQIAMSMDLKSVEMQLALQCAPLITGARISNMLMIDSADESAMRVILRASGISHFRLAARNEKTAFLLFRRSLLEAYLNNSEALDILKKAGYEDFSFGKIRSKSRIEKFTVAQSSVYYTYGFYRRFNDNFHVGQSEYVLIEYIFYSFFLHIQFRNELVATFQRSFERHS